MKKKNEKQRYLSKTYYNQNTRKWNTFKQAVKDGVPQFNKNGTPKMIFASLKDIGTDTQLYRNDGGFIPIRKRSKKSDKVEPIEHEIVTGKLSTTKIITQRKEKSLIERMREYVPSNKEMLATPKKDTSGNYRVDAPFEQVKTTEAIGLTVQQQRDYYNLLFSANKVTQTIRNMTGVDAGFFFSLSIPKNANVRERRETAALEVLGIEGLSEEEQNKYVNELMQNTDMANALILDIAELNIEDSSTKLKDEFLEIYRDFLREKSEIKALEDAMDTITPLEFYKIANKAGYRQMRYYIESKPTAEDYKSVLNDLHALIADIYNKSDILD